MGNARLLRNYSSYISDFNLENTLRATKQTEVGPSFPGTAGSVAHAESRHKMGAGIIPMSAQFFTVTGSKSKKTTC